MGAGRWAPWPTRPCAEAHLSTMVNPTLCANVVNYACILRKRALCAIVQSPVWNVRKRIATIDWLSYLMLSTTIVWNRLKTVGCRSRKPVTPSLLKHKHKVACTQCCQERHRWNVTHWRVQLQKTIKGVAMLFFNVYIIYLSDVHLLQPI